MSPRPAIQTFSSPFPQCIRAGLHDQQNKMDMTACDFEASSALLGPGGSQTLCCEDTHAGLWRGPRVEELMPCAHSQHQLAHRMWETRGGGADLTPQAKPLVDAASAAGFLTATSSKMLGQNHSLICSWRNCEIVCVDEGFEAEGDGLLSPLHLYLPSSMKLAFIAATKDLNVLHMSRSPNNKMFA